MIPHVRFFIVAASLMTCRALTAQDAIAAAAPHAPLLAPAERRSASALDQVENTEVHSGAEISSVPKRFQYGLRFTLRGVYDDNIFLRRTDQVGDFYLAFEPGITLGYGDIVGGDRNYFRFDYSPSFFLYADHPGANAIQHLFRLEGEYRFGRLTMSLAQSIQLLEGANPASLNATGSTSNPGPAVNLDSGGNTKVNIYSTTANLSYDLTGKTFLTGNLSFNANEYPNLISSETVAGNLFINYTYSPKLVIGLGGTAGYNLVASTDQTYEQANLRVSYELTGKINLNASAGVEFRQFSGGNSSSATNISPVYEIGASYQPFDGTSLSLTGNRRTQNSAVLQSQDYATTNITFSARQRFLRRIYLSLVLGYENTSYFSTANGVFASRSDNYYVVQPAVDVTLTSFWTVGGYYLHRQDESSTQTFSFNDNQVGLRTSLFF